MPLPDVTIDTLLSAVQLAKHTGVIGGASRGFRFKLYRWIQRGVIVQQTKVKLRAVRDGGRWFVRWGDFLDFRQRCTQAAGVVEEIYIRTPSEMKRASQKAREARQARFAAAMAENRRKAC